MNAPPRTRKAAPGKAATPPAPLSEWTRPITDGAPCGPNLEYDNDYAVLLAKLAPQSDVQYGDFVGKPESPDWSDIERDCRRLLARSKDIVLLICLCRCRARLAGAAGLAQALEGLLEILYAYPDAVHPQLEIDGQADPAVRANAIANLADPGGLLADMRDIVVASNAAFHLTLKDLERSFAVPRPADAIAPETVLQQLAELQARGATEMPALARAAAAADAVATWSQHTLGEAAPDLGALRQLLAWIPAGERRPAPADPDAAAPPVPPAASVAPTASMPPMPRADAPLRHSDLAAAEPTGWAPPPGFTQQMSPAQGRAHARQTLRAVREWLQHQEPSNPVAVVLLQAERMIGMRYGELARALPLELFTQWENGAAPQDDGGQP
jgi:type VI secretion system protein ImpA